LEERVKHTWTENPTRLDNRRITDRRKVSLPARLSWKDRRGTVRFASVMTRDVSECGVYVECRSAVPISLYRLVQFQLEQEGRASAGLPESFRQGKILSAVYRISPAARSGEPHGLALRLMVEPRRLGLAEYGSKVRATA
jgi:hypothetical protein